MDRAVRTSANDVDIEVLTIHELLWYEICGAAGAMSGPWLDARVAFRMKTRYLVVNNKIVSAK
jgi:hypothetical protein